MSEGQDGQLRFLESCVKQYKIFIDTSSLLLESTDKFFENIVPILEREHKNLIMPYSVYLELDKLARNSQYCRIKYPDNPNLNALANKARQNVVRLYRSGLMDVRADKDDGDFADSVFLNVLMRKRMQYDMLLITQDRDLATDALKIGKDSQSVKGVKKILVERINRNGFLSLFFNNRDNNRERVEAPSTDSEDIPIEERFAFATTVVDIKGMVPVSNIPTAGDEVIAVRGNQIRRLKLLDRIGGGGEGDVYLTSYKGIVAKIYKADKITRLRHEKLKLMLTKNINCDGVCFPLTLVHNQNNEFVGYLMRSAAGRELISVFIPPLLKKYFSNWDKNDTVQLSVTILRKLKYLHDRNVILGDINPRNILVVSPTEVYFVDTDSWQVEGFVCPVGMPTFTAPELIKKKSFGLRSIGNENFAVATLLFMLMLPGKPPYAMQGGEGISDNILKGDFSYPLGERRTGKTPEGPWRFCWSHLPFKIKEAFYETFRLGEAHYDEKNRYGSGYWLRQFINYLELLKNGTMREQDEESLLLFPTRFKRQLGKNYVKCKLCGRETDEEQTEQGICRKCLHEGETYHCAECGCEMVYSNYQKLVKHAKRHAICKDCFNKRNMVFERRVCIDCGREFEITNGEKEAFERKKMYLPKRCPDCRAKRSAAVRTNESSTRTVTADNDLSGFFDIIESIVGK